MYGISTITPITPLPVLEHRERLRAYCVSIDPVDLCQIQLRPTMGAASPSIALYEAVQAAFDGQYLSLTVDFLVSWPFICPKSCIVRRGFCWWSKK